MSHRAHHIPSHAKLCYCFGYESGSYLLFLGGLIVAIAVEHCSLHKRIALRVLLIVGTSPSRYAVIQFCIRQNGLFDWFELFTESDLA